MGSITTAQFKKGMFIEFRGEPNLLTDMTFVNPGKGSAFVRTKLKSLTSGKVIEFTFKSGESAKELDVATREMQFLYKEGDAYVFMDNTSFEQYNILEALLSDFVKYLRSNDTYQVLVLNDEAVGVRFPKKVWLKVTESSEGIKGNSSAGATKTVETETGAIVTVPLFIKEGDTIGIDPETGTYLERG